MKSNLYFSFTDREHFNLIHCELSLSCQIRPALLQIHSLHSLVIVAEVTDSLSHFASVFVRDTEPKPATENAHHTLGMINVYSTVLDDGCVFGLIR